MATPIKPASGEVIQSTSGSASVTFEWEKRTNQEAYRLRYKLVDDANWTTIEETSSATSKTVTLTEGEYIWSAQVKYGGNSLVPGMWELWYSESTFSVYDAPTVTVTAPSATITDMPINYSITFSDDNGTFAGGTLNVYQMLSQNQPGPLVYTEQLDGLSGSITADEFLPPQSALVGFDFIVASSTTLKTTARTRQTVSMVPPRHGTLAITNDPDTGYSTLTVGWDNSTGSTAAVSANLYRVDGDNRVLIASGLTNPSTVVDKYAPLNKSYTYQVVTFANSGAFYTAEFTNKIVTDRWFAIWDGGEKSAWAEWNPKGSYKLTRPQKKRVHYVGREYPVSYDGTALDETHSITFTVVDMDSWSNGFIELMHDGGRGVYKSVDGKVFWADFEITNTPDYTSITRIGTVSIDITRIEGDAV